MGFVIREAEPSDASALATLHIATWREAYAHVLPAEFFSEEHIAGRHKMWTQVLGNPRDGSSVQVAENHGSLVGFAWTGATTETEKQPPTRERQLYAIYVLASHYGTGAGQSLLDEALGNDPAMLWVAKENPRAIAFYVRNGFRFDGAEQTDPAAPRITDARMIR